MKIIFSRFPVVDCPTRAAKDGGFSFAREHSGSGAFVMLLVLVLSGLSSAGYSAEARHGFDVPELAANEGLNKFAQQAGQQVLFPLHRVRGITTNVVKGEYTVAEAIEILLEGTGLKPVFGDDGVITIESESPDTMATGGGTPVKAANKTSIFSKLMLALLGSALAQGAAAQEAGANNQAEEIEEIVVIGIKGALDRAREVKRNASSVVDAISLEDLGKFTDDSVIDALQRVPGVQIQRDETGGGGSYASIRGLGPQFVTTTVNGRSVYGTGSEGTRQLRSFGFDVIPTDAISGVLVRKTPTADSGDIGIAGGIDLQTFQPLDTDFGQSDNSNFFGSFSASNVYDDATSTDDPLFGGIVGGRFNDEKVGAFVAFNYGDLLTARGNHRPRFSGTRDIMLDNDGDGVGDEARTVQRLGFATNPITEERERRTISGGIQFKPNDNLNINLDGWFIRHDIIGTRQRGTELHTDDLIQNNAVYNANAIRIEGIPVGQNGIPIDVVTRFDPGARVDVANPTIRGRTGGQIFDNKVDHELLGGNLVWNKGNNEIEVDMFYQSFDFSNLFLTAEIIDLAIPAANLGYDFTNGQRIGIGFSEALRNADYQGGPFTGGRLQETELDNVGFKFDFTRQLEKETLSSIKFGISYDDVDIDQRRSPNAPGVDVSDPAYIQAAIAGLEGVGANIYGPSEAGYVQLIDVRRLQDVFPENLGSNTDYFANGPLAGQFQFDEQVLRGYGQLNFEADSWSGNVGVQIVSVEHNGGGVVDFIPGLTESGSSYEEILPSANFNFVLGEDLNLRIGTARTISRPDPSQVVSNTTFQGNTTINEIDSATSGNANLLPFTTDQVDVTLEWYTGNGGVVYVSVFYKEVSDFILVQAINEADVPLPPGFTFTEDFFANQPVNASDGTVKGFEINAVQPLDFIADGLGVTANYTFVDSELEDIPGQQSSLPFPGASEHNYNASVYYENYGFSIKISYTFRDEYLRALAGTDLRSGANRFTDSTGILDATISYQVLENLQLRLTGTNITDEDRQDYADSRFRLDEITNFATYTAGIIFTF